jgi:hypothetical protein
LKNINIFFYFEKITSLQQPGDEVVNSGVVGLQVCRLKVELWVYDPLLTALRRR